MMQRTMLSNFYDMDISVSSENASELESTQDIENGNDNDSYAKELEERKKYVQEFINKSFQHFKKGLDFNYIHDQDMNYYQENYSYHDANDRPMLGDDTQETASNDTPDYDPDYDEEVNRLLDEVEEVILQEKSNPPTEVSAEVADAYADPKREQYEDYYNEFPEDMHHVGPIPNWYQKLLNKKLDETKSRLENLSKLVCFACASTGLHIQRIEQDHSTVFCKMDDPRHPPLDKPWTNFWKFNCMIKCREMDKPNHAHTAECESVLLEHANTGVSTLTKNISRNEYPQFVMDAVELFQDFAIETTRNIPFLDSTEATDTVYEKPIWTELKLRSNYKNELMIVVRGKGVTSLISKLKRYFDSGPGRTSNVISVFCINQKWSQKKTNFLPSLVTGICKLRDKVGPISINYEPKTNIAFNSVEAIQLGKIIQDYADLSNETTLLDIGCNFGVLSLMMSHTCDRVIGLNTMHFVNSELSQAEELKKFNQVRNVSFMGCDPKDVLTKCSPLIRRCITVAILNLSSPYGKSVHVMQALRDLPSIWRVIVYGSFTKDFHRNISMLTSKDDLLGENYLPMQYCILDKSLSDDDAFDIVILFERKSLITPNLELLASGPTVNVKVDSEAYDDYGSLDSRDEDANPIIKIEKGFGTKLDHRSKKYLGSRPFIKYRGPLNKFGKFDSPMLPLDKEQKPEIPKEKAAEKPPPLPPPPSSNKKFDFSLLRQKAPPISAANKRDDRSVHPPIKKELRVKELKRIYDSPSLTIPKQEKPSLTNGYREKTFDCSVLRKSAYPSITVKKEFQSNFSSPPRERFVSSPPPPLPPPRPPIVECSILDASQIKKEKDAGYQVLTTVKAEPVQSYEEKEEGELSPEDDQYSNVPIKAEVIDPNYFVGFSEIKNNKEPAVSVKTEPAGTYEIPCKSQSPNVKREPVDMEISDIEGMETPKREPNARTLSDSAHSSPLVGSTNFATGDGFKISINQSFLPFKRDPDASSMHSNDGYNVKQEPAESERAAADADEEIEIIDERKPAFAQLNDKQARDSEPRIRIKSLDKIIKVKSELDHNDDLRTLIEKRKTIQRKLDSRSYKELRERSSSPELPRKYRRPSPPSSPFRKYHRSPSPRRFARSPSPRRFARSPSPRKYSRLASPCRYRSDRSPSGWRYKRSPPSPAARTWIKRERERSPNIIRKYGRSPSPNGRRYRKSPQSPIRFKREHSPVRFKREALSPVSSKWDRSGRSPSPSLSSSSNKSFNRWEISRRSKSPVKSRHEARKRRSRPVSPVDIKRKRQSISPITLSPSPPKKRHGSEEREKKKKKSKSQSKSKSPSRSSKKKIKKESKHDSQWDIPALSTLSSTAKSSGKTKAPSVEATIKSVPIEQTEAIVRERASRSRSRTPIPGVDDVKTEVEAANEIEAK